MDQTRFNVAGDEINIDDSTDTTVYCHLCKGGRRGRVRRSGRVGMGGWGG